ncbi:MAG: integrase arm-type DNA-binding domain-containing protein [Gammaproteobacteria bacterium]|nr:integrase arm-type DNA-binding domain-containing protein [Gammaproteobacteria bacterium]MBT7744382.1 integrase arm-type DNA-binding domain-containing protein [Alphaproteobacteria bacterium]
MPKANLTNASIQRLKRPENGQVDYWDQKVKGLGLRIGAKGTRTFNLQTRVLVDGLWKDARIKLGLYPSLSLAAARERAGDYIAMAQRGENPRLAKAEVERLQIEQSVNTFGNVAARFMEEYVLADRGSKTLREGTRREYRRILQTGPDTKSWYPRKISAITKADVKALQKGMKNRGASGAADRALAYLNKFFRWCASEDLIEIPPTWNIEKLQGPNKRTRILDNDELPYVWKAFDKEEIFGPVLKLLLLTGQRRGEVVGMEWRELSDLKKDAPKWTIPEGRTKNKLKNLVPLAPEAVAILQAVPRRHGLVFSTNGQRPLSGFGRLKARIDKAVNTARDANGLEPMEPWTLHDLRRTLVTGMNEIGVLPHIVEAVVNHVSGAAKAGVAGTYNHAKYEKPCLIALKAWERHLMAIVTGVEPDSNITDLTSERDKRA